VRIETGLKRKFSRGERQDGTACVHATQRDPERSIRLFAIFGDGLCVAGWKVERSGGVRGNGDIEVEMIVGLAPFAADAASNGVVAAFHPFQGAARMRGNNEMGVTG